MNDFHGIRTPVITKTPLRVSFLGGGTDLPEFFLKHGSGAVLGTTVNKYLFHSVIPFHSDLFDYSLRLSYSRVECVKSIDDIEHAPFRECLRYLGISKDIEIDLASELPSFAGMGSSSSFVVGLLNALLAFQGKTIPKMDLAYAAIEIERGILREAVGCQDQVFAAVGGLNVIEFSSNRNIIVNRIPMTPERAAEFESYLMLFFTGIRRKAVEVEEKKIRNMDNISNVFKLMLPLVDKGYRILTGNGQLSEFGYLLHETWHLKRQLEKDVSNSEIENLYETAILAGALGGKLLGAGGGGFMLLFVPPEKQDKVRRELTRYHEIKVEINTPGSTVIYS
ncbi:MAG TPA: hypothetical protein VN328_07665 [Thermodesulfovibrionales bacterium]|nr:hypothetical protein [Thermodesulfovibrionales bacterium]